MSAFDFEAWAVPSLELQLRGKTYSIKPPSVEDGKKIAAAAVRGEINLGLVKGEIPTGVQAVLDSIGPDEHPALGDVYKEMKADGLDRVTIDRAGYYAVFYWARGREYASSLGALLWTPRDIEGEAGEAAPKAP